ncbi:hypothetical protein, partial [Rhizobium johnstonii]|uniref:hypothetical protein n=1 Tax=Rhizobium johnstonii TaxID=3019933 RepID=UPI003F9D9B25
PALRAFPGIGERLLGGVLLDRHALHADGKTGRAPGSSSAGMSPIVEHPDVDRMLLTMKALTQGARAISYACAHAI